MSPTVEQPSRVPSGICQPGALRLSAFLRGRFDLGDSGCYNPNSRTQSGGPSFHVAGQAIDLTANWHDTTEAARGVAAMQWAIDHADELNLQEAIFGHRIITSRRWGEGVRFYAPTDHENHLHIALGAGPARNWAAGTTSTGDDDLTPEQDRLLRDVHEALPQIRKAAAVDDILVAVEARSSALVEDIHQALPMIRGIADKLGVPRS